MDRGRGFGRGHRGGRGGFGGDNFGGGGGGKPKGGICSFF